MPARDGKAARQDGRAGGEEGETGQVATTGGSCRTKDEDEKIAKSRIAHPEDGGVSGEDRTKEEGTIKDEETMDSDPMVAAETESMECAGCEPLADPEAESRSELASKQNVEKVHLFSSIHMLLMATLLQKDKRTLREEGYKMSGELLSQRQMDG